MNLRTHRVTTVFLAFGLLISALICLAWWDSARGYHSSWRGENFMIISSNSSIQLFWGSFVSTFGWPEGLNRTFFADFLESPLHFSFSFGSSNALIPIWVFLCAVPGPVYLAWLCTVKWMERRRRVVSQRMNADQAATLGETR